MRNQLVSLVFAVVCITAQAKTLEGVEIPDQISLNPETTLSLNGTTLLTRRVMLMNFRVYVAALYATTTSKDPAVLLTSDKPRRLRMVFLRSVDRKTLIKSWGEGYVKNCADDCECTKPSLEQFDAAMIDVKDGTELLIDFDKKGVTVNFLVPGGKAPPAASQINDPLFGRYLLSIFIGPNPASEHLKSGLLGK